MKSAVIEITVFILVYFSSCFGVNYGPSIVSLLPKYNTDRSQQVKAILTGSIWKNSSLYANSEKGSESESSQDGEFKVLLKDYQNFAVVLPLLENRSWATALEIWRLTFPSFGEKRFSIEAPEHHGLVAVIQELDINVRQSSTCSLYIKFGDSNRTTQRICGKVEKGDPTAEPQLLIGPRAFSSPNGKMTMYFNAYPGLLGVHSNIRVAIAFTAYKEGCYFNNTDPSDLELNPRDYKPCAMRGWQSSCINSKLFCDDVINCGDKEEFEKDEANCYNNVNIQHLIPIRKFVPSEEESPSTLSPETRYILYSHFTSSVIGIIGFFTFFFVIRYMITRTCGGATKSKPLVAPRHQLHSSFTNSTSIGMNLNMEMEERNSDSSNTSNSTEPSFMFANPAGLSGNKLYSMARSQHDDPPSYFDLFPRTEQDCATNQSQ